MYDALFPFDRTNLQSLVLRLLQNLIAVKAKERFRSILASYECLARNLPPRNRSLLTDLRVQ
jgi:hypothetical protein